MISLGLSAADLRLFNQSLRQSHEVDFRVKALDLSHNLIEDLSDKFIDGQVNVDVSKEPTRDASVQLVSQSLFAFESNALAVGAGFASVMLSIEYGVRSELLTDWVWVPVFCGPLTEFERNDYEVTLTASGKESQLLTATTWRGKTYPKGYRKTDLVRDLMQSHGETHLDIPEWSVKTNRVVTVGPNDNIWPTAKSLAGSWGSGTLAYDGRGRCKLFNPMNNSRWDFHDGTGGDLISEPQVTYSMNSEFVNACRVYGPTPAKGKKQIYAEYVAPANHPLSPQSLARNGSPTYYANVNRDSDVSTQAAADKLAKDTVNAGLVGACTASFDAIPIPHLEPWDVVSMKSRFQSISFRLMSFSIPLNVSGNMTVGYTAKVSNWKKRPRRSL